MVIRRWLTCSPCCTTEGASVTLTIDSGENGIGIAPVGHPDAVVVDEQVGQFAREILAQSRLTEPRLIVNQRNGDRLEVRRNRGAGERVGATLDLCEKQRRRRAQPAQAATQTLCAFRPPHARRAFASRHRPSLIALPPARIP